MPALRMRVGLVVKPLTNGLRYISSMPVLSAPSANSFTFRSLTFVIRPPARFRDDLLRRLGERSHAQERLLGLAFRVSVVDEERRAAGPLPCLDVAPTVADDEGVVQVDLVALRRFEQAAGIRFPAGAEVRVVVVAHHEFVDRQLGRQAGVDLLDLRLGLSAARDVRLVRDDDQYVAGIAQAEQRVLRVRQHLELGDRSRRERLPVLDEGAIDHTVAIKKYGSLQAMRTPIWFL